MRFLSLLLFLFASLLIPVDGYTEHLTILTEELPPYNYQENGELVGSSVAVVREIQSRIGQDQPIQVLPWARAYHMALTRPNVMLLTTIRTAEREELFHWVGPLSVTHMALYARQDADIRITSLDDAKQVKSIGTYRQDVTEHYLEKRGFTNLASTNDPATNLKKLLSGRIDLWITSDTGARKHAKLAGVDPTAIVPVYILESVEAYLAFSLGTPEATVALWRRTLEEMKGENTFYTLSSKWLSDDNIPTVNTLPESGTCPTPLRLLTENAPPSSFLENGQLMGMAVEIVEAIKERTGYKCPTRLVPWARGYDLALKQPNVALFAATRLPQREHLFQWVGPLYSQTWGFYAHKGHGFSLNKLEDAQKAGRIGTYRSDAKEQFLRNQGFTNLVSANNNEVNPRHLISDRIDLWASSDLKMPYFARQAGVDPMDIELVLPFRKVDNYIIFSHGTPKKVVDSWQQALDDMKADGSYSRIFMNWTDIEWARED